MVGTKLAHYEITSHLGSGGMGDVYQATDTKLGRRVAIKLLPAAFASDPERLSRFAREAQMLAALNHPNIAQIYGIEESGDTRCIVMELVEGETLQSRLLLGPIPTGDALTIAKQIAEALEAAHENGVIHRDLKPGNIMLTAEGRVKVLDFGLAKASEAASGNTNLSNSPTLASMAATNAGVILGTAAYMSPEQAKGRAVDRRTDIFAFGCILYEMLTAKRAFDGEDVTDILGAVLRIEPDWSQLPDGLPPDVHKLLRLCLEKNPKNRRSDATDVRLDIEHIQKEPATASQVSVEIPKRPLWARAAPIVAALVLGIMITIAAIWKFEPTATTPVARFTVPLEQGQRFTNGGRELVAISPDGSQLVYVANSRLYHRQMSELEARPIPGTEVWGAVMNPVFSPDGRSLVFWASSDGTLKKIAVSGGASVTLCQAGSPFGISWGEGGIAYGEGAQGIFRVSENGGEPQLLASVEADERAHGPQVLPGGEAVLYTVDKGGDWDKAKIFVKSLTPDSPRQLLIDGGTDARYVSTGHIVYAYGGTLFAVPFDLSRLKVAGGQAPVVEGVQRSGDNGFAAHFSFSTNGTLIYIPGPVSGTNVRNRTLALLDPKSGALERLKIPTRAYFHPRVSPDHKYVAVSTDDDRPDVWIIDLAGASAPRQLTLGGKNQYPIWSSDGKRVAFQSDREGDQGIWWQEADGTGTAERLTKAEQGVSHIPDSWSPDGKTFSYTAIKNQEASLWVYSLEEKKATLFEEGASASAFSPDGHWLAYQYVDERGIQIFVQPFPATGAKYPVFKGGGDPAWSQDGLELFINSGPGEFAVVSISTRPTFSFGEPVLFSQSGLYSRNPRLTPRTYDVAPTKRLIGTVSVEEGTTPDAPDTSAAAQPPTQRIEVVLNWFTDLLQRVPVK